MTRPVANLSIEEALTREREELAANLRVGAYQTQLIARKILALASLTDSRLMARTPAEEVTP